MRILLLLAAGSGLAILSLGCTGSTRSDSRTAGNTATVDTTAPARSTEIGDTALEGRLKFENIMTRDEGGILRIQAQVKNVTADSIRAQYRVEYYDATGWQMRDASSSWQPFAANGKDLVSLDSKAPSPGATKFRFTIRRDVAAR